MDPNTGWNQLHLALMRVQYLALICYQPVRYSGVAPAHEAHVHPVLVPPLRGPVLPSDASATQPKHRFHKTLGVMSGRTTAAPLAKQQGRNSAYIASVNKLWSAFIPQ